MAQQPISSVIVTGRTEATDNNFTELYTLVAAASANATAASANAALALTAANTASANIAAFQAAWTSFTPVVTAGSGTFTSTSPSCRYMKNGKIVHFYATVFITTNGTAATSVNITLPSSPQGGFNQTIAGYKTPGNTALIGDMTSSTLNIFLYDGTYPGADGAQLTVSGTYEAA